MQPSADSPTSLKLWVVMNRALRSIEERLRRQVEAHGLSMTDFAVLEVLLHRGMLPIGEIGGRVLRTSGSMTYVIDRLVQRGLIQRQTCPDDRRVNHAELTPEGRTLVERVFPEHAALISEIMGEISETEQEHLIESLKAIGLQASEKAMPLLASD